MATLFDSRYGTSAMRKPTNQFAITIFGSITLFLGLAYLAFAGCLIFAGTFGLAAPPEDPWQQMATLFGILPVFVVLIGMALLPVGILGLLAGLGTLLRRGWGRTLTIILAALAGLLGLVWLIGSDGNAVDIALGSAQVLYSILAIAILITRWAEFSCPVRSPELGVRD
jgi:hypothetical protein